MGVVFTCLSLKYDDQITTKKPFSGTIHNIPKCCYYLLNQVMKIVPEFIKILFPSRKWKPLEWQDCVLSYRTTFSTKEEPF